MVTLASRALFGDCVSDLRRLVLAMLLTGVIVTLLGSAPAFADAPWWQITTEAAPTHLPPGGEGTVIVGLSDLGDAEISGAETPVTVTDRLPEGLIAVSVAHAFLNGTELKCPVSFPAQLLTCTFAGTVNPYEQLTIPIKVKVEEAPGTVTSLPNEVTAEGGGAPRISGIQRLSVSGEAAPFGVQSYELQPSNEDGAPATQAGAHPFQLTTTLVLSQTALRHSVALPKDLSFRLPPGLIGNPNAVAQCSEANFAALVLETNLCPASSVVGVATVTAFEPIIGIITKSVPVFNLIPAQGEPARFGFEVIGKIPIVIDTAVRSGRDYAVVATVRNATEVAGLLSSQVTLWGVPGDPRHNASRGWECVAGGAFANQAKKPCPATSAEPEQPFLTLPTFCAANPAAEPLLSSAEADSWAEPGLFLGSEYAWMNAQGQLLGFEGCSILPFSPEIDVSPEEHSAATPTGIEVNVRVPQTSTLEAGGLAEADVRDTTVTLPQGVELSPSAANALQACSEQQMGFQGLNAATQTDEFTDAPPSCPEASKVGTVHIKTPLLTHELEGSVYLASPAPNSEPGQNPFDSLVALYLVAQDPVSGVLVKLAGEGHLDEGTLRVSTAFRNTPQVPFEELKLDLFGGHRASLSTPSQCGAYATDATFTPWSGTGPVSVLSPSQEFTITSGVGDSACPALVPFSPGFSAGSTNGQAGAFTSFSLELSRPDGDQALSGLSMHLPSGIAALLSSVTLCTEAQANADACPPESQVGEATAVAGLGPEPYVEGGGKVFITGPYGGAPFGLDVVTPAVAGPFNLGMVTVRSKLFINPGNASVTIVSDPLPTELRGIPLQLKRVLVSVNRPSFEFNPTNCTPMEIEGTLSGSEGAVASVSSPFDATGCENLPFAPKLTAVAGGHGSKADGTSLEVTVESGGVNSGGVAQAGIAKVDLQLPLALSSRLPTLQKACVEAVFDANPASCDEGSVIGDATIHTPVLTSPLSGPAYLVSHGAEFPDVEFVLQGEGITLVLDGKTDIKHGITYSRFESTPDAPFTVFETVLPAGPHGVLSPNVPESEQFSLCKTSLAMPTEITGQNGAVIDQTTKIAVSGCGGVLPTKTVKLTRAQLLADALAACKKKHKHARSKRVACEKQARKTYGTKQAAAHKTAAHKATKTASHGK
jgi:hypothetical protein